MKNVHFIDSYLLNPTHPVTVDLVGVGGTGSHVLSSLASINHALVVLGHPGLHVTSYDPDEVSPANIGRQLFCGNELGLNKAVAITTRINRFYGTSWQAVPGRYAKGCAANIIISCVDNVKSRLEIDKINRVASGMDHKKNLYWMDFGNGTDHGQVILGTLRSIKQPKSKKFNTVSELKTVTQMFDLSQVDEKDSGPSCSLAEALSKQDLLINPSLARLGCRILWKMLTAGMIDFHGLYLNLDTMNMNPIKI